MKNPRILYGPGNIKVPFGGKVCFSCLRQIGPEGPALIMRRMNLELRMCHRCAGHITKKVVEERRQMLASLSEVH